MFSQHATTRMQQRGISPQAVELLLAYGRSSYHRGREVLFFDSQARRALQHSAELEGHQWERICRNYLVLEGGTVLTVGHKTCHFKRDRH